MICRNCGGRAHLAKVCFKASKKAQTNVADVYAAIEATKSPQILEIAIIEDTQQQQGISEFWKERDKYTVAMDVNGQLVNFEIDSGAAASLMPLMGPEWLRELFK